MGSQIRIEKVSSLMILKSKVTGDFEHNRMLKRACFAREMGALGA